MTFGKKDIKDRVNKMYGSYGIMIMISPLYSKSMRSNIPSDAVVTKIDEKSYLVWNVGQPYHRSN